MFLSDSLDKSSKVANLSSLASSSLPYVFVICSFLLCAFRLSQLRIILFFLLGPVYMIPLSWDEMKVGIILMYWNKSPGLNESLHHQ